MASVKANLTPILYIYEFLILKLTWNYRMIYPVPFLSCFFKKEWQLILFNGV